MEEEKKKKLEKIQKLLSLIHKETIRDWLVACAGSVPACFNGRLNLDVSVAALISVKPETVLEWMKDEDAEARERVVRSLRALQKNPMQPTTSSKATPPQKAAVAVAQKAAAEPVVETKAPGKTKTPSQEAKTPFAQFRALKARVKQATDMGESVAEFEEQTEALAQTTAFLEELREKVKLGSHRYQLCTYSSCFVGREVVTAMIDHNYATTRLEACSLLGLLLDKGFIAHVVDGRGFVDGRTLYAFVDNPTDKKAPGPGKEAFKTAQLESVALAQSCLTQLQSYLAGPIIEHPAGEALQSMIQRVVSGGSERSWCCAKASKPPTKAQVKEEFAKFMKEVTSNIASARRLQGKCEWQGIESSNFGIINDVGEQLSKTLWFHFQRRMLVKYGATRRQMGEHARNPFYLFTPGAQGKVLQMQSSRAIIDIKAIFASDKSNFKTPVGYEVIDVCWDAQGANLNDRTGGPAIYLCYKRAPSVLSASSKRPITGICVIIPSADEDIPYGYEVVRGFCGIPANLNTGNQGKPVYLCVYRGDGAPVTEISFAFKDTKYKPKPVPYDFHEIKMTVGGELANLNVGTSGMKIHVCFKINCNHVTAKFERMELDFALEKLNDQGKEETAALEREICMKDVVLKILATLVVSFYWTDEAAASAALCRFWDVHKSGHLARPELNLFVNALCEAVPYFVGVYSQNLILTVHEFLSEVIASCFWMLRVDTFSACIQVVFRGHRAERQSQIFKDVLTDLVVVSLRQHDFLVEENQQKQAEEKDEKAGVVQLCFGVVTNLIERLMDQRELDEWERKAPKPEADKTSSVALDSQGAQKRVSGLCSFIQSSSRASQLSWQQVVLGDAEYESVVRLAENSVAQVAEKSNKVKIALDAYVKGKGKDTPGPAATAAASQKLALTCSNLTNCFMDRTREKNEQLAVFHIDAGPEGGNEEALQRLLGVFMSFTQLLWLSESPTTRENPTSCWRLKLFAMDHVLQILTQFERCIGLRNLHLQVRRQFLVVIKRFLCPSLVACFISEHSQIFERSFQIFKILWKSCDKLNPTMGAMAESLMRLVEATYFPKQRKVLMLSVLQSELLISPAENFFNFDLASAMPSLFQQLIGTISSFSLQQRQAGETYQSWLQSCDSGLMMLTSILTRMRSMLKDAPEEDTIGGGWQQQWEHKALMEKVMLTASNIVQETGKLKKSLEFLAKVHSDASETELPCLVADFLSIYGDKIDKSDIGDVIGACDDNIFSDVQYQVLREHYMARLNFAGLSFDEGLRLFLCDGGFKLPGEAQKIDRIISAFCSLYCSQNPGAFSHPDNAFVLAFAMIMLNTDIHDKRLKMGKNASRKPMSVEAFISNLRGANSNGNFKRRFLVDMYNCIKSNEIAWKEDQEPVAPTRESIAADKEKELGGIVRRTYQALREAELAQSTWTNVPCKVPKAMVLAMFDSCASSLRHAFEGGFNSMESSIVDKCIQGTLLLAHVRPLDAKLDRILHLLENHRHQLHIWEKICSATALFRNQRIGYKRHNKVVCGSELVGWMLENGVVADVDQAVAIGMGLYRFGLTPVGGDFSFENNKNLYSIVEDS